MGVFMKKILFLSTLFIAPFISIECAAKRSISTYILSAYTAASIDLAPAARASLITCLQAVNIEAGTIELKCKEERDGIRATIRRLYVEPSCRSRVIGKTLFNAALEFLINYVGVKSIEWDAAPLDEHTDAIRLIEMYRRLGGIVKKTTERGCHMVLSPETFLRLKKEETCLDVDSFKQPFIEGEVKLAALHHY